MSNEITHNTDSGLTLYACRFQKDGDVFITDGSSDEVWGTSGHTADTYDVTMTEEGTSGHYKGDFDTSANIGAGVYDVVVRQQAGGSPADDDDNIAQGEIFWDGTAEINQFTISSDLTVVDSNIDTILSDLLITDAVVDTIASDLIIIDSNLDVVNSDLVVMDSNIDTVVSDINYVIDLEQLQYNNFGDGTDGGGNDGTQGSSGSTGQFGSSAGC